MKTTHTSLRLLTALLLLLLCTSTPLHAKRPQGQIRIIPKTIERQGDRIVIAMTVDFGAMHIRSVESRVYTPILVADRRRKEQELPVIVVKGPRRYRADLRAETLSGRPPVTVRGTQMALPANMVYTIEQFTRYNLINYRITLPWRDWMEGATIDLREDIYACCGILKRTVMHRDVLKRPTSKPAVAYITPEREVQKLRSEIGEAYLDFAQGSATINPAFRNNRSELEKINQLIVRIVTDPDVRIRSIEMRGYASPESPQANNERLSRQRAQAMREYFARHTTTVPASTYRTGNGGEDWDGLQRAIARHPELSKSAAIAAIIRDEPNLDRREQQLQTLDGGAPYRTMMRDIFPKLRRVDCQVDLEVRDFNIDEVKERIYSKPRLLSLNEMYEAARTYPEGSTDFNRMMQTAREQFPDSDVANINAAAAALTQGDTEQAAALLNRVQQTDLPAYQNNLGVYWLLKGDRNRATDHLRRAAGAGMVEANRNLQLMQSTHR